MVGERVRLPLLGKPADDTTWLSMWDAAHRDQLEGLVALGFNALLAAPTFRASSGP